MSVNDITGDRIVTDVPSEKFKNGWDAIWGNKAKAKKYLEDSQEQFLGIVQKYLDENAKAEADGPLAGCMAEYGTGYCHANDCDKIAWYDDGGCPRMNAEDVVEAEAAWEHFQDGQDEAAREIENE